MTDQTAEVAFNIQNPWVQALLKNTPLGVFVFNLAGQIVDFNDHFVSIIGSHPNQLMGLDVLTLPDKRVTSAIQRVLIGKDPQIKIEIDYQSVTADKLTPVRATFSHVRSAEGKIIGGFGIVEDMSGWRELDSQSAYQLAFENLVARISKRLVSAQTDDLDQTIDHVLMELGQFLVVDRCYVFQFEDDGFTFFNSHEWCGNRVEPQIDSLQGLKRQDFPWMLTQLEMEQVINIYEVAKMPDSLSEERDFLQMQGIESVLMIPWLDKGELKGFLGIDAVNATYYWPNDKIVLLQVVAETLANAFARRSFEKALKRINRQYQEFSAQVPLGLYRFCLNAAGETYFEYCNNQFLQMNGVESVDQVMALTHMHPDDRAAFIELQKQAWQHKKPVRWEGRYILDGETRWMHVEDSEPHQNSRHEWIWNGFQQDITDRKQLEQRLKELATVDDMTQLWNRRYFIQACEDEFARASRYDDPFSFLMLDADKFKKINDDYGHAAGDAVLVQLADVMQNTVRNVDLVGRLGGEEFAILLPTTGEQEALKLAERIRVAVEAQPAEYNGKELPVTISIGVSAFRQGDKQLDDVILRADKALYQAKNQGRNRSILAP